MISKEDLFKVFSRTHSTKDTLRKNNNLKNKVVSTSSYNSNSSDDIHVTYMDTVRVDEISKELKRLADEYNKTITKLFTRLSEVPRISKEWIGNQADYYFNTIASDKSDFLSFGNNLRNVAIKLDYDVNHVLTSVNRLTRLESEARYNDKI